MATNSTVAKTTPSGRPASWGNRIRERIDSTMVVEKLQEHVKDADAAPMTQTQIMAARILLDRTLPVLKQVEVSRDNVRDIREISAHDLLTVIEGEAHRIPNGIK